MVNEFANSKKINPLIFLAASIFADEKLPLPKRGIITRWERKNDKISTVRIIFSIASSNLAPRDG